mmetsp:Transcript_18980/g.44231  ORF Transcript_18980/g.44231 Transcript_18980/m.44231 type:complete len:216 (-) Transcript_18980:516-1163(-)
MVANAGATSKILTFLGVVCVDLSKLASGEAVCCAGLFHRAPVHGDEAISSPAEFGHGARAVRLPGAFVDEGWVPPSAADNEVVVWGVVAGLVALAQHHGPLCLVERKHDDPSILLFHHLQGVLGILDVALTGNLVGEQNGPVVGAGCKVGLGLVHEPVLAQDVDASASIDDPHTVEVHQLHELVSRFHIEAIGGRQPREVRESSGITETHRRASR